MASLIHAMKIGEVPAEPALVLAPNRESPALVRAQELGVPTFAFQGEEEMLLALAGMDWLCLAGYMSLVPPSVISLLKGRVLNIHPALLPKFGGRGMYGNRVHEAVIAAKESDSGCTVHWVSPQYDEGSIIMQLLCPVHIDDTASDLAHRVLQLEHKAYPVALAKVIREA